MCVFAFYYCTGSFFRPIRAVKAKSAGYRPISTNRITAYRAVRTMRAAKAGEERNSPEKGSFNYAAQYPQNGAGNGTGILKTDKALFKKISGKKTDHHAKAGVIIGGSAVEQTRQSREQQHQIKEPFPFQHGFQPGHQKYCQKPQSPADQHVRRKMYAQTEAADAYQQNKYPTTEGEPALFEPPGQGSVQGGGTGGMATGKGISLGSNVI